VSKTDYSVKATCFVCGRAYLARYNMGGRAKVCTPPSHKCPRKIKVLFDGRRKVITCTEGCCRSKYSKGMSAATNTAIDSRKFLGDEEYRTTLKEIRALEDEHMRMALWFTLETGCRLGETLSIRKTYLEWKDGSMSIVRIPTEKKQGHPQLPVDLDNKSEFVRLLRKWVEKFQPDELLFPVARRTMQRVFEEILDAVKPDRASLIHILRHTRASRLIEAGFDWNYVRTQLRWSSLELAKIYVHTSEEKVSKLMEKLR